MSTLALRIRMLYGSLSSTQKRIADAITGSREEMPFLSVHDLAGRAGVSAASITRFARMLGFDSLKAFRKALGSAMPAEPPVLFKPLKATDTDAQVVQKVFRGNIRSLEDTLRLLDTGELQKAARALARAERVAFFGIGSSGNVAADAALRFSQVGLDAQAYFDSYQMVNQSVKLTRRDVAVGISHSGRSAMTVKALQLAAGRKTVTIGIANTLNSPLQNASGIFLCTAFPEGSSEVSVAAMSSIIAQMCIVDALYFLTVRYRRVSAEGIRQLNRLAEELLRIPSGG
jgi:DNA-binding MurR/RpiR family transcriptional regulator